MSRNLRNSPSANIRDYGSTQSTSSNIPDVNFAGFSPTEFMSLSDDIANNINSVNSSSKSLEKLFKVIGTPRDDAATRDRVHNIHGKTNMLIESTSKDLQRLTSVVRRGDKQQKLQLEKLTNDFRLVVERYSSVQKRISSAMKQTYIQALNAQMQDEANAAAGITESDKAELLQKRKELISDLQFEQSILVDRERQLKQIEADILDVNAIMRAVSTLTQAQGESVERIETMIDTAASEVDQGREELVKAAEHRRSYQRKMIVLLAFAVIIGLIVTGLIVNKLS